jgi:hypothetical protein
VRGGRRNEPLVWERHWNRYLVPKRGYVAEISEGHFTFLSLEKWRDPTRRLLTLPPGAFVGRLAPQRTGT